MTTSFEFVEVTRADRVSVVTMCREEKRNAMNSQLLTELTHALREEQASEETAVVVLTGRGSVFSSGADRSAVQGLTGDELTQAFAPLAVQMAAQVAELMLQLVSMSKPVVAAVNGHAAGGGMIAAIGCDFRYVLDSALFWMPEITMGRAIGEPSMETLVSCVGPVVAKDIVLTGRRLPAQEMERFNLVNRVLPQQDVLRAATEFAQILAGRDRAAAAKVKAMANVNLVNIWQRACSRQLS